MRPLALAALLLVALAARPACAQAEAEVVWDDAPLADVLYELADVTGLELVFALRLVEDVRVRGRYRVTDDPDQKLHLILRGTGVRAERIRRGQYVLIREPLNVTEDTGPEAYTGTLDGRVVDAETDAPLAGAHVWLVDLGLGDVVHPDGSFVVPLLPTGRYVVRVSHVGYRPVRIELDVFPETSRLPPTVRLQAETVETTSAEVTAGPEAAGAEPGMTDLAARQAAAIPYALGEGDLAATLSWLPGLTRTGGASGALVVRGADPSHTRTVRDGVPLYEPWHAFGLFSAFQPEALARVRFHRGSLPASLGGGLAAVLDVETTDALAGDTLRTVGLGAVAARAVADVPLGGRAGLHVGLRRSTLGLLLVPGLRAEGGAWVLDPTGGDPFRRGEAPRVGFADVAVKLSARLGERTGVQLAGTWGGDRVRVDLPPTGAGGLAEPAGGLDYGWNTHTASAKLQALRGSRTLVTALAYRTGHASAEDRLFLSEQVETDQRLVEHGASIDVEHVPSFQHQIRGGLQVASRNVTGTQRRADSAASGSLAPPDQGRQRVGEVALHLADTWRPAEGWQLQPGLRAEALVSAEGISHLAVSPRLFARWTPDEDRLIVRAGLSRQTQAVHRVRDRAAGRYALAASRWLLADDRVPLASAWQLGAGAEWAPGRFALSLDVYARRSRGLLEPGNPADEAGVDPPDLLATHPAHDGRAAGVELAARTEAGDWTLGLSAALARAEVRPEVRPEVSAVVSSWRPSAYDRPVAVGVIAQHQNGPWTAALRLDVESGLSRADGRRDPVQLRASAAVGASATLWGLRWTAQAQATARALGPETGQGTARPGLPLATDARGLPGWPVASLSARW